MTKKSVNKLDNKYFWQFNYPKTKIKNETINHSKIKVRFFLPMKKNQCNAKCVSNKICQTLKIIL